MRSYSLLLALIVSGCGILSEPKKPEMIMPKKTGLTELTRSDPENFRTLLLTGDPQGIIYAYPGKLDSAGELTAIQPDSTGGLSDYIPSACDSGSFFVIKWSGDSKYEAVIRVIDQLKKSKIEKYAITPATAEELRAVASRSGRHFRELENQ